MQAHKLYEKRFGRLLVLRRDLTRKGNTAYWVCRCDCGTRVSVGAQDLLRKDERKATRSCGCLGRDKRIAANSKHGFSQHPLYSRWRKVKERCKNDLRYVGNGISMCDEWSQDPDGFIKWSLRNGWEDGLVLDRIDNNFGYSPQNCRWVTAEQNANNRSSNRIETAFGITDTVANLIRQFAKVPEELVRNRLSRGWRLERALLIPARKNRYA